MQAAGTGRRTHQITRMRSVLVCSRALQAFSIVGTAFVLSQSGPLLATLSRGRNETCGEWAPLFTVSPPIRMTDFGRGSYIVNHSYVPLMDQTLCLRR